MTLAKGLAVLESFGAERPAMTLSQVAQALRLSRATARRILRTLAELGYVTQNGRSFSLSSGILKLGFAYLATQNWIEQAMPLMRQLGEQFHESCSAAILDGTEIVYVARFPAQRIMSVTLAVGTRLPAFHTSLGRIQLGFLDEAELWRRIKSLQHRRLHALDHHRHAGFVRSGPRGSCAGFFDRRRRAGTRAALDRGAGRAPFGPGDRRP